MSLIRPWTNGDQVALESGNVPVVIYDSNGDPIVLDSGRLPAKADLYDAAGNAIGSSSSAGSSIDVGLHDSAGTGVVLNSGRLPVYLNEKQVDLQDGSGNDIGSSSAAGAALDVALHDSAGTAWTQDSNGGMPVNLKDSERIDAFGRLRVSNPTTIFDNVFEYDLSPRNYSNSTTGAGNIAHDADLGAAVLSTGGTTSGDNAILQTKRYMRYQPGKSQIVQMTGTLGDPKANVRQRIGYFDASNGLYFEQIESDKKVVIRSSTSGSPVNTEVSQSSWNIDTMDGNGASGITIDFSKDQIFHIDFQFLGAGRVRFGFVVNDSLVYCHEFNNANNLTTSYMTTGNLPCRTEIENTGVAASETTLEQFCTTVISEGGVREDTTDFFAVGRGTTALGVTTRRPVLSIRPSPTYNSITNRGHVIFDQLEILAATNNCLWELVYNGSLTGASWSAYDATYSIADYDTAATAISGGVVLDRGWAVSGLGAVSGQNRGTRIVELFNDFAGTTPDTISIVCTAFTGTTNINALIRWEEQK